MAIREDMPTTAGSCLRPGRGSKHLLDGISPHCNMSLGFPEKVNRAGISRRDSRIGPSELGELGGCVRCGAAREVKGVQKASLEEYFVRIPGFMCREVKRAK